MRVMKLGVHFELKHVVKDVRIPLFFEGDIYIYIHTDTWTLFSDFWGGVTDFGGGSQKKGSKNTKMGSKKGGPKMAKKVQKRSKMTTTIAINMSIYPNNF